MMIKKTENVYYMRFFLQTLPKYLSHISLWSKILEEYFPNKMMHAKCKQDQMTNSNIELYFKIRNANKDEMNLPVGEFITRTNLNRQANQRRFVQKICKEAYKDRVMNNNEGILKRSMQSLISFFAGPNSKDRTKKI